MTTPDPDGPAPEHGQSRVGIEISTTEPRLMRVTIDFRVDDFSEATKSMFTPEFRERLSNALKAEADHRGLIVE